MCTYDTRTVAMAGCSGKGPQGWARVLSATVYYDHPVHAPAEHTVNIDFLNPERGPSSRIALELSPASARDLAHAILRAVDSAAKYDRHGERSGDYVSGEAQASLRLT